MTEAHPLYWPDGWPRTAPEKQERGWQFKQRGSNGWRDQLPTFATARDQLYTELQRLGATRPVISTNHPADRNGTPKESKRRVRDEGVAVYFTLSGRPLVMACDRFDNAAANMRSLALAIEALRQLERHGGGTMIERAFTGFLALPSNSPWDVLGLKPGATRSEIEGAYRNRAKRYHPDHGGSQEQMANLNTARTRLLQDVNN